MFEKRYLIVATGKDREASTHLSECNSASEVRYIVKHAEGAVRVFQNVTNRFVKEETDGRIPQRKRRKNDAD